MSVQRIYVINARQRTDGWPYSTALSWWRTAVPPTKTFTDPRLCAAIVGRLTFGGDTSDTGTDPYRLASTRQLGPKAPEYG
ncbi:hypothetical protein ACH4FX_40880 [Streptomyces sp. NPDC018019]|uniref:hypothetical protein n=1 Tax=Streptomyces sp. NPDC018019 TaxID=3365030 RepID=UPI00379286A9